MNFLVFGMSFLRYFIPLIIDGNKRGIKSRIFISESIKYDNPYIYLKYLKRLASQFCFKIHNINEINDYPADVTFYLEGTGINIPRYKTKKVVIVATLDFTICYKNYIDISDYIIFPSEFIAKYYKKTSNKNLYLGSPKYDVSLNEDEILKKYDLPTGRKALIIFPRENDANKINVINIYEKLKHLGYFLIVKGIGKCRIPDDLVGDKCFIDFSWFPHSTMELIKISNIAMNFDSAASKELVMLKLPFVNFSVKNETKRLSYGEIPFKFLYNYNYCINFNKFDELLLEKAVEKLMCNNYDLDFNLSIEKHLFQNECVSKNILDRLFI